MNFERNDHATKWLPVKDISVVWAQAQRGYNEIKAKEIQDNFDPDLFGVVTVTTLNGDGQYHCIDGQTRVGAIRDMWGDAEKVPCNILNARTKEQAAHAFRGLNNSKPVAAIDKFRTGVTAGYPTENAIFNIGKGLGYTFSVQPTNGHIGAVQACLAVYHQFGGDIFRDTLSVLQGTWGLDYHSTSGPLIRGYGTFLNKYGHDANWQRLTDTVQKKYTPGRFMGAAKTYRELAGGTLANNIVAVLVATYNASQKKGRLEA